MKKKQQKRKPLPKTLYVYRERDFDNDEFLVMRESPDEIHDRKSGDLIGIYELKETKTLEVSRKLV